MASSIESVSYELGSLAGVTVLETILTAVYTNTIHLPATAPAQAAGSIDEARAAAGHLPAGQAHTLLDAAASAFDNGYTLALAITVIALTAGSAFTYRYLKRQPPTSTEQAQHPEPAQHGGQPLDPAGCARRTAPAPCPYLGRTPSSVSQAASPAAVSANACPFGPGDQWNRGWRWD
jgi:DHA2 family multidrug resistance protein-like MFS transporter